jgi:hypothetical protein
MGRGSLPRPIHIPLGQSDHVTSCCNYDGHESTDVEIPSIELFTKEFVGKRMRPARFLQSTRERSFVLLHAFESLFKLGDQRSLTVLKTVAPHDTPEKIADGFLVSVVHGQQIFGRPARREDDNVSLRGSVHDRQLPPLLNGVLHGADRIAIF